MSSYSFRYRHLAVLCAIWILAPVLARAAEVAPQVMVTLPLGTAAPAALTTKIEKWRADGLVSSSMRLDKQAGEQEDAGFSTLLLLQMKDAGALERWQKAAKQDLPANARVRRVDAVVSSGDIAKAGKEALFEVNIYRIKASDERYRQFCNEYIVPLMAGQVDAGFMGSYTMFVEEGTGADRNSILVKAYDAAKFERVAPFKLELRERLAKHPTYPKWHPIKDTLRADVSETLALRESAPLRK